jgi:hypothetical protein
MDGAMAWRHHRDARPGARVCQFCRRLSPGVPILADVCRFARLRLAHALHFRAGVAGVDPAGMSAQKRLWMEA